MFIGTQSPLIFKIKRTYDDLENYIMSLDDAKFEKLFRLIVPV